MFAIVLVISLMPRLVVGPADLRLNVTVGEDVRTVDAQFDCDSGYFSRSRWDGGPKTIWFKHVPAGHCEAVVRAYDANGKQLREQRSTAEIF